jgi:hypothetical protein
MNKIDQLIEYYIQNNIKFVSKSDTKQLSSADISKLHKVAKLNKKIDSIKVSESFGKNSFKNIIKELDVAEDKETQNSFIFSRFGFGAIASSALLIALMVSGFGFFNNSGMDRDDNKLSTITSDGSVTSINNISLADVETENSQLDTEAANLSSVKSEMITDSNVNEAIDENI